MPTDDPDNLPSSTGVDPSLFDLGHAIDEAPGLHVVYSHGDDTEWSLAFSVEADDLGRPTHEGWLSLEFIAWVARDYRRAGTPLDLTAESLPPYLNHPGRMLTFTLSCERFDLDPEAFAAQLRELAERYYIPADQVEQHEADNRIPDDDEEDEDEEGEES